MGDDLRESLSSPLNATDIQQPAQVSTAPGRPSIGEVLLRRTVTGVTRAGSVDRAGLLCVRPAPRWPSVNVVWLVADGL
jgi:hypothetical protein